MPRKPRDDQNEREIPPIPDGGLASSMPDWLRRPPAWRDLPDRDAPQTTPESTTTLPDADTSEIDPRTFIHDDDLPMWLRSLRLPAPIPGRDAGAHRVPEDGEPPGAAKPDAGDQDVGVVVEDRSASPSFRPRRPPMPETAPGVRPSRSEPLTRRDVADGSVQGQTWLTMLLGAALLVAIIVIIVLLVA